MRTTLLRGFLLAQGVAIAVLAFAPDETWAHVIGRVLAGWVATAVVVVGVRRHRPPAAAAFYLFGLGIFMNVCGTLAEKIAAPWEPDGTSPTIADPLWLAVYPALIIGMALLIRRRGDGRDWTALVDTTIITVGVGLLSWVFLIQPQVTNGETLLGGAVLAAYPLADLVVLGLMLRLLLGGGHRALSFKMMIVALLCFLASDLVWAMGISPGPVLRHALAMNYQVAYTLVGAAALHPSVRDVARPAPREAHLGRGLLAGLAVASLVAPALLMFETARGNVVDGPAIAVSSTVLFLLVLTRMAELVRRIEDRTRELGARNRSARLVLDTVNEGLLRVARDGTLAEERSAMIDRWFGSFAGGTRFTDYIARVDASFAEAFALGHEAWLERTLPAELCLEQLPRRLHAGARELTVSYLPVSDDHEGNQSLLLVIEDVTLRLQQARQEAEQRELMTVLQGLARDRAGLLAVFDELDRMLDDVASSTTDLPTCRRLLHTIKGNASLAGLSVVAQLAHAAEAELEEQVGAPVAPLGSVLLLRSRWLVLGEAMRELGGDRGPDTVELPRRELERLGHDLAQGLPVARALERLWTWRCEPVGRPLARLAQHARTLSIRLGKGDLEVVIEAADVWLETERWRPLWTELVHVVNNAIDHGIEAPEERQASGKSARGRLRLAARLQHGGLIVEAEDDGRGIDWEAVRRAAAPLGLPTASDSELAAALLTAGVSTRAEASMVSGRGLGMSAVAAQAQALEGQVEILSQAGLGTCLRLSFPAAALARRGTEELRPEKRLA
jgi:HPt (histidine-containing phosphotransfer) domain-containing protein